MTNLKIRNILISDLKLFLIKGAPFEENETCFLYKGVSYTREPTVICTLNDVQKVVMLRTNKNYLGTFKARCYHLLCCLRKNFVPCLRVEL